MLSDICFMCQEHDYWLCTLRKAHATCVMLGSTSK